nr:hypothetical protein [Tanacetum cinerariifolium]
MILDSYTNSMCLDSWGLISYARVLIEINACNDFSDNLVMAIPNLKGNGYTKEIIRIEYKWTPPRCSTCLIYGHSFVDCPKIAPKRVVNSIDKGKGQTSEANDECVIEVIKKKSGGNNEGNENFKPFLVKPKTHYRPKAKQSTEKTSNSPKATPFEVSTRNKATTSGMQEEGQRPTPLVKMTNVFEKHIIESKLVLVDDARSSLKRLIIRGTYENANYDYNLYDDDMYEGKRFSVRAKETTGWIPDFDEQKEDNSESEDEQSIGFIKEDFDGSDVDKEGDNNVSMVPDSVKEDVNVQAEEKGNDFDVNSSLDPFELYPLLNKNKNVEEKMDKSNG